MKKAKIIALLAGVMTVCGSLGIISACSNGNGVKNYTKGDVIVDGKDVQITVDGDNNVVEQQYSGKEYTVKYLVGDSSYVTLTGAKAEEMKLKSYSGDVTSISLSDIERDVKIDGTPVSVVSVEPLAFYGCETLETVDLTKRNKSLSFDVGAGAFAYCTSLSSLTLPENVYVDKNQIGDYAFRNCEALTEVSFGDNFSYIGVGAFKSCTALESIALPSKLTKVQDYTFADCESLSSVTYSEAIKSIGDYAFDGTAVSEIRFDAMPQVRYIGEGAYRGTLLNSVNVPDTVTTVCNFAFYNCEDLTSVSIPFLGKSATVTAGWRFDNVYGMTEGLDSDRSLRVEVRATGSIPAYAFYGCDYIGTISVNFAKSGKIPVYSSDGISYERENLTVSDSVNSYSFAGCKNLTRLDISADVTQIGSGAFSDCYRLGNMIALDSVEAIGDRAFANCRALTSIKIPASVKSLGSQAFADCIALKSLEFEKYFFSVTDSDGITQHRNFGSLNSYFGVYTSLSDSLAESSLYTSEPVAGSYANSVMLPSSLTSVKLGGLNYLPSSIFNGWKKLASAQLTFVSTDRESAESVIVGSYAFGNCQALTSLTISDPEGVVESIGSYSFYGCRSLGSFKFPTATKTVGSYALGGCYALTQITLPESLTFIGGGLLADCISLRSITVESYDKEVRTLNDYGYTSSYYATNLTGLFSANTSYTETDLYSPEFPLYRGYNNVWIPYSLRTVTLNDVTSLAQNALRGFESLTTVNLQFKDAFTVNSSEYKPLINAYAFSGCTNLNTLNVEGGSKVLSIGERAFENCVNLSFSQVLPFDGVQSFGSYAFSGCASIGDIVIPASLTQVNNYVFYNCGIADEYCGATSITFEEFNNYRGLVSSFNSNYNSIAYLFGADSYYENYEYVYTNNGYVYVPTALNKITLNSVAYVNGYAFYNMSMVREIEINAKTNTTVTYGDDVFTGCSSLRILSADIGRSCYGILSGCNALEEITFVMPQWDTSIFYLAQLFDRNASSNNYLPATLTKVTLVNGIDFYGDRVTGVIPENLFYGAYRIQEIEFDSDYVSEIGANAFYNCQPEAMQYREDYVVCNGWVTEINYNAYNGVVIDNDVVGFVNGVLDNVTEIYYRGSVEEWANVKNSYGNFTVYYSEGQI